MVPHVRDTMYINKFINMEGVTLTCTLFAVLFLPIYMWKHNKKNKNDT